MAGLGASSHPVWGRPAHSPRWPLLRGSVGGLPQPPPGRLEAASLGRCRCLTLWMFRCSLTEGLLDRAGVPCPRPDTSPRTRARAPGIPRAPSPLACLARPASGRLPPPLLGHLGYLNGPSRPLPGTNAGAGSLTAVRWRRRSTRTRMFLLVFVCRVLCLRSCVLSVAIWFFAARRGPPCAVLGGLHRGAAPRAADSSRPSSRVWPCGPAPAGELLAHAHCP